MGRFLCPTKTFYALNGSRKNERRHEACETCKHATRDYVHESSPPEFLRCDAMSVEGHEMGHDYYRMYEAFLTDGDLIVKPDFGCVMWEAKE
jgi:hypothetical protein